MLRYVQNRIFLTIKVFLIALDFIFLNLSFFLSFSLCASYGYIEQNILYTQTFFSVLVTYNLVAIIASMYHKLYLDDTVEKLENVYRSSVKAFFAHQLIFTICLLVASRFEGEWFFMGAQLVFCAFYLAISRFTLTYFYTVFPRRFDHWNKRIALIGHNEFIGAVEGALGRQQPFFSINTIVYNDDIQRNKEEKLAMFRRYFEEASNEGIHDIFIVSSPDLYDYSKDLILAADFQCVQLNFVPVMTANLTYSDEEQQVVSLDMPVLRSHEEPMSTADNRLKKRLVDLLISGLVIIFILSWLVPIIGLIIKIQSPGPIFFKQPRSGRNNVPFYCLKFRSMVVNKDSNKQQATKGDRRITPIGAFLRKSSLDEFPQFINVFLGQMSVVGPRPHMLSHTEHYSRLIQHYMVRHLVKPGITGWAQVNGFRGETTDPTLMAKRVEYDIAYMSNWSAMLDFKIVCMTVINAIRGEKNAY